MNIGGATVTLRNVQMLLAGLLNLLDRGKAELATFRRGARERLTKAVRPAALYVRRRRGSEQ